MLFQPATFVRRLYLQLAVCPGCEIRAASGVMVLMQNATVSAVHNSCV
jgi:hypothetical protein